MTTTHQLDSESSAKKILEDKINSCSATVAVMGMGYVGFPLARAVHQVGYDVIGFDVDDRKIEMMKRGESFHNHLDDDFFRSLTEADERFEPTSDTSRLKDADIILLCVPTPLGKNHEPDLSCVLESARMVSKNMRKGFFCTLLAWSNKHCTCLKFRWAFVSLLLDQSLLLLLDQFSGQILHEFQD